jgi:hypothetical protein
VAQACNLSYSGGREQKDHSSKPAQANSSQDLISKIPTIKRKRTCGVTQGVGPEFKPQYYKNNNLIMCEFEKEFWCLSLRITHKAC